MADSPAGSSATGSSATGSSAPGIRAREVTKRFGDVVALRSVSLEVPPRSFVSLLGPSGCGKTTLLRLVGGFEVPDAGRIHIGGRDVTGLPPQKRPTAMVFQSYALFPTMTVGENVGYGLRVQRRTASEVTQAVDAALQRVDLAGFAARPVSGLSGGQQQRVALARALAARPQVILFDEPLSNLDLALREATRAEIKRLHAALGLTSLYVTHDQQEAMALSDQVVVMREGCIVAQGRPERLYADPPTAYVARFLGGANVIREAAAAELLTGERPPEGHVLVVRPEALSFTNSQDDALPGRVRTRQFLGLVAEWTVETDAGVLRVWSPPDREAPDPLFVCAERSRWVHDDTPAE